ncbi:MAG TPA: hypothetical protein VGF94_17710 [Kofleriaceae bacterium]
MDRDIAWTRERTVLPPVAMKTKVAYVDSALDRVTLVDLSSDTPAFQAVQIGRNAIAAIPSPDKHTLFVVTRGEEAITKGEIDQPPMLWAIDPSDPSARPLGYAIGSPFDLLAVSPDNTTAIAYFSGAGPDSSGFFRNPNELAVVDLTQPPSDTNPSLKTIRSFGAEPNGIVMSPPMVIAGAADPSPRTFAFVLADDDLTVFDATHPERDDISIRLDQAGSSVSPKEIVFAPASASAYVRSDHASDVLQVLLEPLPPAHPDANDYLPQLAELGAGGGPTDIAVYDDPNGTRFVLAATPSTGQIVVIQADTAQFRTIAMPDPIDRILLFPDGSDGSPPTKALFASIAADLPELHVLDLANIFDPLVEPTPRTITLDQPVRDVVPVGDSDLAMVVHDDARTVLGMLDMTAETTAPMLGVGTLDDYAFTPTGAYLVGATSGVSRIGFVELDDLHPSDLRLDDPPAGMYVTETDKILVDHADDPFGHITVIPSPTATRSDLRVYEGFLAANLLDKEP